MLLAFLVAMAINVFQMVSKIVLVRTHADRYSAQARMLRTPAMRCRATLGTSILSQFRRSMPSLVREPAICRYRVFPSA